MQKVANPPAPGMARMSYLEALIQAQMEELERDERVIVIGEDISIYGGGKMVERFDSTLRMPQASRKICRPDRTQ